MEEEEQKQIATKSRVEMEELSLRLRDLILSQPPKELLGYLLGLFLLGSTGSLVENVQRGRKKKRLKKRTRHLDNPQNEYESLQFALEYLHAVLASFKSDSSAKFDEAVASEILDLAEDLRTTAMFYCMTSSHSRDDGVFGDQSFEIEFLAKSNWVLIRGNRYQVLEGEYYHFVLLPHNDVLKKTYGTGAESIARSFQEIADSMRVGHMKAAEQLEKQMQAAQSSTTDKKLSSIEAANQWREEHPEQLAEAQSAIEDLLRGGICNLSKHTELPEPLLQDLSYRQGENKDFFAQGELCGTPLRTLPARIRPLIQIDNEYFATDPAFLRDSGYRALQRGLLRRAPEYKESWNRQQKVLSETAFPVIFQNQLAGAEVFHDIYYQEPDTGRWYENDTLILLDDVLIQIEAKAGISAITQSPAQNYESHVRAIKSLIIKAYKQSERFFRYLSSADEVPIYTLEDGTYAECERIRFADYRLALPIGLTIESLPPFSTMCQQFPEINPILGKHAFLSMSIDDLFVLNRFLPRTGDLFHYLEVRQAAAGIKGVKIFDECDHLGSYITQNRYDMEIEQQLPAESSLVVWHGFSAEVDKYFEGERWKREPPPSQDFPSEVARLLAALEKTKSSSWLRVNNAIRDYDEMTRSNLASLLRRTCQTLGRFDHRWFMMGSRPYLLIWLHKSGAELDLDAVRFRSKAGMLAVGSDDQLVVVISATASGDFASAKVLLVKPPMSVDHDYAELLAESERAKTHLMGLEIREKSKPGSEPNRKLGRNEPCWCGSGKKFKKCHGSATKGSSRTL